MSGKRKADDDQCGIRGHEAKPLGGGYWRCWVCREEWSQKPPDQECARGFQS